MKNILRKSVVGAAVAMAFSTGALAVPITNGLVSADVNASGTFASLSFTGTEFTAWGTPLSYYWLNSSEAGSPFVADNAGSTNPLSAITFGAGTVSFSSSSGGLVFNQTISLIGNRAAVTVLLANTTGSAITDVQWGVGIDPDQGIPGSPSTYDTVNSIDGQGAVASATAMDPDAPFKSVTLRNTTSSGAFDIRAYVDPYTCCSPVDPGSILSGAAQAVGAYGTFDRSINLAYNIGTIEAGKSASIGYEYIFAPIPEPETYAMLMAGLGLMGVIARRRKRQSDAV